MKKCCSLITLGSLDAAVVGEETYSLISGGLKYLVYFKTVWDMVLKW